MLFEERDDPILRRAICICVCFYFYTRNFNTLYSFLILSIYASSNFSHCEKPCALTCTLTNAHATWLSWYSLIFESLFALSQLGTSLFAQVHEREIFKTYLFILDRCDEQKYGVTSSLGKNGNYAIYLSRVLSKGRRSSADFIKFLACSRPLASITTACLCLPSSKLWFP